MGQSMVASSVVPVARLDCLLSDIVLVMSGTVGQRGTNQAEISAVASKYKL